MAAQIPPRRSWWYYGWRWIAITAAFFIWVVIDSLDVLSRLFPTWREPAWMRATTEVRVVPMLGLIGSMIIATAVVVWIIRKENTQLREIGEVDNGERRLAHVKGQLRDLSLRALGLHNEVPHEQANQLLERWIPLYEQLKADIRQLLPMNYKTRFRTQVMACEHERVPRSTPWDEDRCRQAIMCVKNALDTIISELGDYSIHRAGG